MNLLPFPRVLKRQAGIFVLPETEPLSAFTFFRGKKAPDHPEGYALTIDHKGVRVDYHDTGGLRAAGATLRQLLREYGRRLPCLKVRDWPERDAGCLAWSRSQIGNFAQSRGAVGGFQGQ